MAEIYPRVADICPRVANICPRAADKFLLYHILADNIFGGHVRDFFGGQLSAAGGLLSTADNCPPIVRQYSNIFADKVHHEIFGGLFFGGLSAS